jgi:hypothetical protein
MKMPIIMSAFILGFVSFFAQAEDAKAENTKKEKAKTTSVPQRFVPGSKPMKGESAFEGASWMSLTDKGPPGPNILWTMVRSGIGDQFPVQKEEGPILFWVTVTEGDDAHLVLELPAKDGTQKIELKRDKAVEAQIAGVKYEFLFPTMSVAAAENEKPTTPKATIMVTCPK